MLDLFTGQYDNYGRPITNIRNNDTPVVTKAEVGEEKLNTPVVTENVSVQEQVTLPLVTPVIPQQQEEIKSVETAGIVTQSNITISDDTTNTDDTSNAVTQNDTTILEEKSDVEIQEEVVNAVETIVELDKQGTSPLVEVSNITKQNDTTEEVISPPADTFESVATNTTTNYSNTSLGLVDGISLMEMCFSELVAIVENLLNIGLALIASMPKLGKSWFCLLLCLAVATGKEFLGFKTNRCEVLYLSFESSMRSLQSRLQMLLQGEEMPEGVHFYTEIKTLDNGLLEFLQDTINKNPRIKLIIIDTFQFIRSNKTGGGTLYQKEYKEMSQLKDFADKNKVCILCVHHLKNTSPSKDVFQKIYGSNRN